MKLTKHAWTLWGIALALTLALMLLIPFVKTTVYVIALICTIAMFGVCAWAFTRAFRRKGTLESKLLGWPIFKVGYSALFIQAAVGFILMALAALCPVWAAALAEIIVFALTAASLTVKDAVRETVGHTEAKTKDLTLGWKAIRAKAAALAGASNDPRMKKVAEEIRFADPMPTVVDGKIADALAGGADASKLEELLNERKAIAKEMKK